MKKISTILFLLTSFQIFSQGQFKIRNDDFMQIGYNTYKTLTFGQSTGLPNNGKFAIEYWDAIGGLNIWKPWPTAYAGNYFLFIRDDGNVGIGNAGVPAPSPIKLNVSGIVRAHSFMIFSDENLKTAFDTIINPLDKVIQLKTYSYKYITTTPNEADSISVNHTKADNPYNFDTSYTHYGFKAQEVSTVLPDLIKIDPSGKYSMNYSEMIPILVKAIQVLEHRIKELENEIH